MSRAFQRRLLLALALASLAAAVAVATGLYMPTIPRSLARLPFVDEKQVRDWQAWLNRFAGQDAYGRLHADRAKHVVACPRQDPGTAVLLLLGQSNAGNHAQRAFRSDHGERVLNYHDSRCYVAESPLLGASGKGGESWTPLGDLLVARGIFSKVILVPAAVDGTPIRRWQDGGDLQDMLRETVAQVSRDYRITHVLWHQGERDFADGTMESDYRRAFGSMLSGLRAGGVAAPVFVAVATKCAGRAPWQADNPVARAQQAITGTMGDEVFAGVDTDRLIGDADRFDGCHFAAAGQQKFAHAWFEIIAGHQSGKPSR